MKIGMAEISTISSDHRQQVLVDLLAGIVVGDLAGRAK